MSIERLMLWAPLCFMAYVTIVYPVIIALLARMKTDEPRRRSIEPNLSIVVAAHNEIDHISKKIQNLLALDYPADRLEILIGSDGSTDGTLERLRARSEQHIRLFVLPERQGKPAVLNQLIPSARGEIVVLADARQRFEADMLRRIVQPFTDGAVGAVSGELVLTRDACPVIGDGCGVYWRYEKWIRANESRLDSTVGATGAIYAIRRELFEPIPEDTILDDVLIPLQIVRRGYRVLFEPGALAWDSAPRDARHEFARKVRTLAGNFQLFSRERWLLSPTRNRLWWQTMSHKAGRLFFPLCQLSALIANSLLAANSDVYRVLLGAHMLFYLAALTGMILQRIRRKFWLATLSYTFCLLSWATVVGFVRHITRRQRVTWKKAAPIGETR